MLLVLSTIALLTVMVNEGMRSATVRIQMAGQQRDEARAEALALGGVQFYRLFLIASMQFDRQLAGMTANISGALAGMFPGLQNTTHLWELVPELSTSTLRLLIASDGDEDDAAEMKQRGLSEEELALSRGEGGTRSRLHKAFLDFDGDFVASVKDEDSRIYVGEFGTGTLQELQQNPNAGILAGMMSRQEDMEWLRSVDLEAWELIADLVDWTDPDDTRLYQGGSEVALYDVGDDPVKPKNAPFDSLEEIRLVHNWERDAVWERYGRLLTIYGKGRINVNTAKGKVMEGLFNRFITPPPNQASAKIILDAIQQYRSLPALMGGGTFRKPQDFVQFVRQYAIGTVDDAMANAIATNSSVFRVTSEGTVGKAKVTMEVVIDFTADKRVGKIVYWRVQ